MLDTNSTTHSKNLSDWFKSQDATVKLWRLLLDGVPAEKTLILSLEKKITTFNIVRLILIDALKPDYYKNLRPFLQELLHDTHVCAESIDGLVDMYNTFQESERYERCSENERDDYDLFVDICSEIIMAMHLHCPHCLKPPREGVKGEGRR